MKKSTIVSVLLLFCGAFFLQGQKAQLLKDIHPGNGGSFNFLTEKPVLEYQGKLYFVANSPEYGLELWVYDGATTELFMDINPGAAGSDVDFLFEVGNKLLFAANDGVHGYEWWVSDGTTGGTQLLIDLMPGTADGLSKCCYSYASRKFHVFKDELYFNGNTTNWGYRLYKTDGTPEGTVELKMLNEHQRTASGFLEWKEQLFFEVYFEGLWKTDGTPEGTIQLKSKADGPDSEDFEPGYLTDMGDYMLLINGYDHDLWRSDGTPEGTVLIKKMFYPAAQNNVGHYFFRKGSNAYFPGSNPANNTELWKTDGTITGTSMVTEIETDPGFIAFYPKRRVLFKDKIFYLGGKNGVGNQLFYTDGTAAGTQMLIDLKSKINGEVYFQTDLVATEDYLFFVAGKAFDRELWYSDGTAEGTYEIEIANNGESTPERFFLYGNQLFFYASGDGIGYEPHVLDVDQLMTSHTKVSIPTLTVYPNPAIVEINLITDQIPSIIELYDLFGNQEAIFYNTRTIDISPLKPGMKFLKIFDGKNAVSKSRFLKL